jgi:hypothetical protein
MKAVRENLRIVLYSELSKHVVVKMTLVDALEFRESLEAAIQELADEIDIKVAPLANRSGT